MTRLVAAELLKLRTTWGVWWFTLALLALVALTVASFAASFDPDFLPQEEARDSLLTALENASSAALFVLLLGILSFTVEFRHGTIAQTFLGTPVRERVLLAKALAYALVGAVLGALAAALAVAIALPWFAAKGVDASLDDGDVLLTLAGVVGGAALWGALGVGLGGVIRSQVFAIVGALVWLLVIEFILYGLFDDVGRYLPGVASRAMAGRFDDTDLARGAATLVSAGYAFAALALAGLFLRRRDV